MMGKVMEWMKANFKKYFWYYIVFIAGILACGFMIGIK